MHVACSTLWWLLLWIARWFMLVESCRARVRVQYLVPSRFTALKRTELKRSLTKCMRAIQDVALWNSTFLVNKVAFATSS